MTAVARYLFGRVGPYGLLIPAALILKVEGETSNGIGPPDMETSDLGTPDLQLTDSALPSDLIDLRFLFRLPVAGPGPRVTLAPAALRGWTLILDSIGQLHAIEAEAFRALPRVFDYAGAMADAVCERSIEGLHCLRLRNDPAFTKLPEALMARPAADGPSAAIQDTQAERPL